MRDGDRVADRVAVYQPEFLDFQHRVETHRRTAKRPLELVRAILKNPFDGIGKPESLNLETAVGEVQLLGNAGSIGVYVELGGSPNG